MSKMVDWTNIDEAVTGAIKRHVTSFYVKYEEDTKKLSQSINLFSILLLVGTFLVGIAQNLIDHQVVIDGVKLLSYNAEYLHVLRLGGSAIIGGCIVGLLGSFIHILFYKYDDTKYVTNGFFLMLSFSFYLEYLIS